MCTHPYAGTLERQEHPFPVTALKVLLFKEPHRGIYVAVLAAAAHAQWLYGIQLLKDTARGHT